MTIVMFFALFFPGGYRPVLTLHNPQPIITHIGVPAPVAHPIIVTGRR
jgi:hypothetical protein